MTDERDDRYFLGYKPDQPHPYFASYPEPAENCELCQLPREAPIHVPWPKSEQPAR